MKHWKENNITHVSGYQYNSDGTPNVSCRAVIFNADTNEHIRTAVTDRFGKYSFEISDLAPGFYVIKFYGAGNSNGDANWEYFTEDSSASPDFDLTPPDNTLGQKLTHLI